MKWGIISGMNQPIKTQHAIAVIALCLLASFLFISNVSKEDNSIIKSIEPGGQLAQASPSATFTLSPQTQSATVNGTFNVNIVLNTGGQQIYGVDINRLRFNPAVLQVVDADTSATGVQINPGSLMAWVTANSVDNSVGTIQFSQVGDPTATRFSGSGTLATITFRAVAVGTANVTLDFTSGSGLDSNVAGSGGDILLSVGSGSYTVTGSSDTTAPTAPGTPSLTVVSSSRIDLSWTASTDAVGVTGYRVERCSGSATCTSYSQIATPTGTSYSNTGLSASTIYRYRVRAVDAAGNLSAYSSPANATTQAPPDTTPPTISAITFSGITTTGATITWETNEPADTQVEYGLTTAYGSQTTINTTLDTNHSVVLSGLSPGTAYNYRIKSRDGAGNLATSINNVFTTQAGPDTTNPLAPTGLTATPTREDQIQLSWTAAVDPAGVGQTVSGVVLYHIFRNGTPLASTVNTSYLDTGLTPATQYGYQVAAVDGANNLSTKTSIVNATTPSFSKAVKRKIILVLQGAPNTKMDVSGVMEFFDPTTNEKVYEASITTDATGQYTIDVPSGLIPTVKMRSVIPGYLSKTVSGVDLRDEATLDVTFPTLLAGDFDGNQLINALDFSYMNGKWGTFDNLADVNKDGSVNSLDFSFLSSNWLKSGE